MSRIGKHPVKMAQGTTAALNNGTLTVKGKLGELSCALPEGVIVTIEGDEVVVKPLSQSKEHRALWGTVRANVNNMAKGVTEGFVRKLELVGVGYRAAVQGQILKLTLGYSHDIDYKIPAGIKVACPVQTTVEISGIDKRLVGQVASEVRSFRSPEPYKGKGVKYENETILRKEGKKK